MVGRDRAVDDLLQAGGGFGVGVDPGEIIDQFIVFPPVFPGVGAPGEDPDRLDRVDEGRVPVDDAIGKIPASRTETPGVQGVFPLLGLLPLPGPAHGLADMVLPLRGGCREEKGRKDGQKEADISFHGRKSIKSAGFLQIPCLRNAGTLAFVRPDCYFSEKCSRYGEPLCGKDLPDPGNDA